jgi:ubiquinone/menaquinone biosynthesis C-methylase UbiE
MSPYLLENENEYERLERQSRSEIWNFQEELEGMLLADGMHVLDAGCGSGVVGRHYAELHPGVEFYGCDASEIRVKQIEKLSKSMKNSQFTCQDIVSLDYSDEQFDRIICRYVLEHLPQSHVLKALKELSRCLKPGGKIYVVDIDGYLYNLYPRGPELSEFLEKSSKTGLVDILIGRKLTSYLDQANFINIHSRIQTTLIEEDLRKQEMILIEERLECAREMMIQILGGEKKFLALKNKIFETLKKPSSVLFYNKFIVTAEKR